MRTAHGNGFPAPVPIRDNSRQRRRSSLPSSAGVRQRRPSGSCSRRGTAALPKWSTSSKGPTASIPRIRMRRRRPRCRRRTQQRTVLASFHGHWPVLHELFAKGDQYVFIGMAGTQKAIISYRIGKRDGENTDLFIQDLRQRVLGIPEISTDGWRSYRPSIRDAFGNRVAHGVVNKTYSVVH